MRFQPFIALALVISGAFAGPVAAQEDERFYGRWEQENSWGAGDLEIVQPGDPDYDPGGGTMYREVNVKDRLSFTWLLRARRDFDVEHGLGTSSGYQVIRDFGDRVVLCDCPGPGEGNTGQIKLAEVHDAYREPDRQLLLLSVINCRDWNYADSMFEEINADAIWRHMLERPAPVAPDDSIYDCRISKSGEPLGKGWNYTIWERWVERNDKSDN